MTKAETLTDRQIGRYIEIAKTEGGDANARARVIADKMRRGLKGRFDEDIEKLRRRAEEMKASGKGDRAALEIILEAIEIAIKGKRESSHIRRRTKVHSMESEAFWSRKDALDRALADAAGILTRGIAEDAEYRTLTELKHELDAFIKAIAANGEFSKKATADMQAGYRKHIPAINAVRRAYLEKTDRKHSEITGNKK
ncbi:MAG: hypothetical protein J5699_00245 [Bacteroidales bacterium]|nr:hypothetical protein [Bacteroidales bacterium]